ncbi:YqaE/Pmp3 family membrane protein [Billgrantia sp. LNSP4103-1]|uniref:YqaE/Pmp3 family membrane protein n=1 Tax=Billgrantia sp. LNSP4103-1 TaxID=3410266 RepID=UPI00403F44A3
MDAREYLAKKGLDGNRDEDRPNTLEEKAWERARQSGGRQPHAGTPYDWEDWERYHDALAEGAETIEQKIDREAHRRTHALAEEGGDGGGAVQQFEPVRESPLSSGHSDHAAMPSGQQAWQASAALRLSFKLLAILLPPLAVGLAQGGARRVAVSLLLTLLGWVPGCLYAWSWLKRQLA